MDKPFYLDNHSTTKVDKRVIDKMIPVFLEYFGNPHSVDHFHGLEAKKLVDESRNAIYKILNAKRATEIIFTSGATESNNLLIKGVFQKYNNKGKHIITSKIEHSSVMETCKYLENKFKAEVTYLDVDKNGLIDFTQLKDSLREDTILVSIMYANNEIGTIQNIKEIGEIVKESNAFFHTDAAQALGHIEIDVKEKNIDAMSFSSHKFFGPKGVGGLYLRSSRPYIKLEPLFHGGGQENGIRSGTLNVPGIVGMTEALKIAILDREERTKNSLKEREKYIKLFEKEYGKVIINGHPTQRLPHNLNITIPDQEAKLIINKFKEEFSFSTGSACSSSQMKPSHVLKAIGLSDEQCYQTIRIGL